jgi:hypothetical protein
MVKLLCQTVRLLAFIIFVINLVRIQSSEAAPSQRGFQIPLESISAESLDDIKNNWKANILRIQIGNNLKMDTATGADYDAMLEERFTLLDQKLPLIAERGLKIIFCLHSPPGGLLTREPPSHYRMYSEPALQEEYISKWKQIMARYGSHPAIYAFDIENEPAMRKSLVASGARTWNQLVVDVIAAIRQTHPTVLLIVKSLYGDPSKLSSLPAINDSNIIYAYNSYIYNNYQHSGINSAPFSIDRPSDTAIVQNLRRRISPFFFNQYTRAQRKQIPASEFPPKLIVGEVAVSACARESGTFLSGLLTALETNDSAISLRKRNRALSSWRKARRRGRKMPKPVFTAVDFALDLQHTGYTIHAYGESQFWDPRVSCDPSGTLTQSTSETDRTIVTKGFMSRN